MKLRKMALFLGLSLVCLIPFSVNAGNYPRAVTTYIYEGMDNSNFHMHATYISNGGYRVAWFKVKPSVKQIGGWSCSQLNGKLTCKEPNGITQYFKISSDKKIFTGMWQQFRLIKTVKK